MRVAIRLRPNTAAMMQRASTDEQWDDREWAQVQSRSTLHASYDELAPEARVHPPAPAPARRARSAIGYGLLGFVLGAVFWHFVGFWDFVGQLMFKGGTSGSEIVQGPPPIKLRERVSGVSAIAVVASAEACTMLKLDRTTGETAAMPCEGEPLPLRSIKAARREDLRVTATQRLIETTARGWGAVKIEPLNGQLNQANAE